MEQNVGPIDGTARFFGGLALSILGVRQLLRGGRGLVFSILGLTLLLEGLTGYCLGYGLLGITTKDR